MKKLKCFSFMIFLESLKGLQEHQHYKRIIIYINPKKKQLGQQTKIKSFESEIHKG